MGIVLRVGGLLKWGSGKLLKFDERERARLYAIIKKTLKNDNLIKFPTLYTYHTLFVLPLGLNVYYALPKFRDRGFMVEL